MSQGPVLCCHSPALSYLLYECSCSTSDQKGLLLGSVKSHTRHSITDDPAVHEEIKTIVYIEHCVPLPDDVFGPYAEISDQSVRNWILPYKEKLIGWYSSRLQYKAPKPSLKDIFIHHRLLDFVDTDNTFVFGSLTTLSPYPQSTHSFHYAFHTFDRENYRFVEFPLKICNLSDRTYDSAGCLESSLYPEARNFRGLELNMKKGSGGNIAAPLNNYLTGCTKTLGKMCEDLYRLELERLVLENTARRYREHLHEDRHLPVVRTNVPVSPKRDQGDHLVVYDPATDYSNGEEDQLVFDDDELDEKMDMDETENPNPPPAVTQAEPLPEYGEEPSADPTPDDNFGDVPVNRMEYPVLRVSSDIVQSGSKTARRRSNDKHKNKPANSNS